MTCSAPPQQGHALSSTSITTSIAWQMRRQRSTVALDRSSARRRGFGSAVEIPPRLTTRFQPATCSAIDCSRFSTAVDRARRAVPSGGHTGYAADPRSAAAARSISAHSGAASCSIQLQRRGIVRQDGEGMCTRAHAAASLRIGANEFWRDQPALSPPIPAGAREAGIRHSIPSSEGLQEYPLW